MYVKVGSRWRYVKAVVGKNHKIKPGYAIIGSVETHVPDAAYYIRYREGSKTIWQKCGSPNADGRQRDEMLGEVCRGLP
jgi:hypothetical protein